MCGLPSKYLPYPPLQCRITKFEPSYLHSFIKIILSDGIAKTSPITSYFLFFVSFFLFYHNVQIKQPKNQDKKKINSITLWWWKLSYHRVEHYYYFFFILMPAYNFQLRKCRVRCYLTTFGVFILLCIIIWSVLIPILFFTISPMYSTEHIMRH